MRSISKILVVTILLVMSSFMSLDNSAEQCDLELPERQHMLAQTDLLSDPGFESGEFSVWTNEEDASTNTIQSSRVYSGSYALKMESVYSSPTSWLPVWQDPSVSTSLADSPVLTAAIYPLVTGVTCGEYGQASIVIFLYDSVGERTQRLIYVWSGYNFPGSDTSENSTRGYFKFYGWSTNTWHILNRNLLVDYTACYGTPSDASAITLTHLYIYNHASNGQPGTFYADDVQLTAEFGLWTSETTTVETSPGTAAAPTTPTPPGPTPSASIDPLAIVVVGTGAGVVVFIAVLVVLLRRPTTGEPSQTPYNW